MALTSLKDRVRAATQPAPAPAPAIRPAEVVQDATPDELHAAEQAEGGATTDAVMVWLERHGPDFTAALPACVDPGTFMAAVRAVLPSLNRCTPASLLQALLTCARFGVIPDGRQAVIKAEGSTAVMVPMAQGYIELMYRSGHVASVHTGLIYEGDEWDYEPTAKAPDDFRHKPALLLSAKDRGEPILAYAFCWMTSGERSQVIILTRQQAEDIRDEYSTAYQDAVREGRTDSFWHLKFDAMWIKSAVLRLHKVVPISAELRQLADADAAGEAGRVQIFHAPDEDAQAVADATAAHEAAEGSQEPQAPARPAPRKRVQPRRTTRAQRKGSRR
jgi:phage RecT family recombinase